MKISAQFLTMHEGTQCNIFKMENDPTICHKKLFYILPLKAMKIFVSECTKYHVYSSSNIRF